VSRLIGTSVFLAAMCGALCAADRALIGDFEHDTAPLKPQNDRIRVTRSEDAAVGHGAALVDWQDGSPGWSRGLAIDLPATDVPFDALSLWLKADGASYAAVELRVRHRAKGNYRLPLIVPPVWRRFLVPLSAFRPWGIKEPLTRANVAGLTFRRIGWTGRFLVDHIEWIAGQEPLPDHRVAITVDAAQTTGECDAFWAGIGDDPARPFDPQIYQILAREKVFRHVRVHNMFTDGEAAWERGTPFGCRIYSEDANGTARYDWTRLDAMLDSFRELGLTPILETDFMPAALAADTSLRNYGSGLRSLPADLGKWKELVRATVAHCIDRYGRDQVSSWCWEVWNEPDLWWLYWRPSPQNPKKPDLEGLFTLYDHMAAGARAADPEARVGGPAIAGFTDVLKAFLDHAAGSGTPIDFISWHSYNTAPFQMATVQEVRAMVRGRPALERCEWQINEIGYLAGPMAYNRSGALSLIKLVDLLKTLRHARHAPRTRLVYWGLRSCGGSTFEKVGKYAHGLFIPYGDRLVAKPIFTSFRLLARLGTRWLHTAGAGLGAPVNALATLDPATRRIAILAYHMDDCDVDGHETGSRLPDRQVAIAVTSLGAPACRIEHYRIDARHSSTFDAWKRAGKPTRKQIEAEPSLLDAIARHDRLEPFEPPRKVPTTAGTLELNTVLPGCSASLWLLDPLN